MIFAIALAPDRGIPPGTRLVLRCDEDGEVWASLTSRFGPSR